jgi:DNA polymerase-1
MVYLITNQKAAFTPIEYNFCSIERCLEYFKDHEEIAFDTETEGFDPYTKNLLSLQLGDARKQFVVDLKTVNIQKFKDLLESKTILMQNAKFDLRFLYYHKIVPKRIYDTMIVERILTTGIDSARKALDFLVYKYCKQTLDKTIRGNIHREGLSTRVIKYAADDVKFLHEIKRKQMQKVSALALNRAVALDNEYVKVLAYIEFCGVKLDVEAWKKKCKEDKETLNIIKGELDSLVLNDTTGNFTKYVDNQLGLFDSGLKTKINWNSEKQVVPLMCSIGVDTKIKDKSSGVFKDSIEKKVLAPQQSKHPLIPIYLKYKEAEKLVSTYGENWFDYINPVTGRIHTNYTQIMNTGRLSSGQRGDKKKGTKQLPNMQNVPADERTRSCFISEKGWDLVVSDYSGQEQIVLANKSQDKDIIRFYEEGLGDMHSFIASKIFPELSKLSLDEIKEKHKDKRQVAKAAGFAINYGGQGITIAQNLSISLEEGNSVYEAYFKAFPGLANYFKKEKKRALELGYIEFNSVSNRKCFIEGFDEFQKLEKEIYNTPNFWEEYRENKQQNSQYFINVLSPMVRKYFITKGNIERTSLNYPIQGTSADITKLAGIYTFRYLEKNNLLFEVKMPNVIHDELHLECKEILSSKMSIVLKECMEKAGDAFCKIVKLKAEPCITKYWAH